MAPSAGDRGNRMLVGAAVVLLYSSLCAYPHPLSPALPLPSRPLSWQSCALAWVRWLRSFRTTQPRSRRRHRRHRRRQGVPVLAKGRAAWRG